MEHHRYIFDFSVRFPLPILCIQLFFLPVFVNASCIFPGIDSSCSELISELPWTFSIEQKDEADCRIFSESRGDTKKGDVHLKMYLDTSVYKSKETTADAFFQVSKKS